MKTYDTTRYPLDAEAVITADAADDIVRRMKSENPTEDHDAIL